MTASTTSNLTSGRERVDFAAMQDYLGWEQGWTDGLPVVPPTEDAVRAMLAAVDADPQRSLGVMQPSNSRATLEKLAINAVMAGCKPEHFPVVVTGSRRPCATASTWPALRPPPAAARRSHRQWPAVASAKL